MAKGDTLLMAKIDKLKTLPFGAAYTYVAHIREFPSGEGGVVEAIQTL